jgi:hypothetical protein
LTPERVLTAIGAWWKALTGKIEMAVNGLWYSRAAR